MNIKSMFLAFMMCVLVGCNVTIDNGEAYLRSVAGLEEAVHVDSNYFLGVDNGSIILYLLNGNTVSDVNTLEKQLLFNSNINSIFFDDTGYKDIIQLVLSERIVAAAGFSAQHEYIVKDANNSIWFFHMYAGKIYKHKLLIPGTNNSKIIPQEMPIISKREENIIHDQTIFVTNTISDKTNTFYSDFDTFFNTQMNK